MLLIWWACRSGTAVAFRKLGFVLWEKKSFQVCLVQLWWWWSWDIIIISPRVFFPHNFYVIIKIISKPEKRMSFFLFLFDYFITAENRPGPSNLGQVLSQILLCRQINPDFNQEEVCSIEKDTTEILALLDDMQEFMPKENSAGEKVVLAGEDMFSKWARRRRRKHTSRCEWDSLCCISKSRRLTKWR